MVECKTINFDGMGSIPIFIGLKEVTLNSPVD